jgi:hypothetical protein
MSETLISLTVKSRAKQFTNICDIAPPEDDLLTKVETCSGFLNKNIRHHKGVLMVSKSKIQFY